MGRGQRGLEAGQHGVAEGHDAEVAPWVFLLGSLRGLALQRPDPDYCTGIPPQSVFIRERAKIGGPRRFRPINTFETANERGGGAAGSSPAGDILKGENPAERQ